MLVNGEDMEFTDGLTAQRLLENLKIDPNTVVVEVDMEIINRDDYSIKKLSSSSKVEIIRYVGGG